MILLPEGDPIHSERGTVVEIADGGAGEFVEVSQNDGCGKITIDKEEWAALRHMIDTMIEECRN